MCAMTRPPASGGHSLVVDPFTHPIYIAGFGSVAVYEAVPGELRFSPEAVGANPAWSVNALTRFPP